MRSGNALGSIEWKKILYLRSTGKNGTEIARTIEKSVTSVNSALRLFERVKCENWDLVKKSIVCDNMSIEAVEFAGEQFGIDIPEIVYKWYEEYHGSRKTGNIVENDNYQNGNYQEVVKLLIEVKQLLERNNRMLEKLTREILS